VSCVLCGAQERDRARALNIQGRATPSHNSQKYSSNTCNVRRQQLALCPRAPHASSSHAPRAASALYANEPRPEDGVGGDVGEGGVGVDGVYGGVCGDVGDAARFIGSIPVSSRTAFVEAVASGQLSPSLDELWRAHSRGIMPLQVWDFRV
jgi:hypothetical protein